MAILRPDRTANTCSPTSFCLGSASPVPRSRRGPHHVPSIQQPDSDRNYKYGQYFLFAQDTYKITQRLTVNYGIRYEFYGGPENTGSTKDALIQLGSGNTLAQQLEGASLTQPTGRESAALSIEQRFCKYGPALPTICSVPGVRCCAVASGRFTTGLLTNLWENSGNNNLLLPVLPLPRGTTNFLRRVQRPPYLPRTDPGQFVPRLDLVDPDLRNGRVKSYFAGVQQRITDNLTLEVNGLGSYGRALITTDVINRSSPRQTAVITTICRTSPIAPIRASRTTTRSPPCSAIAPGVACCKVPTPGAIPSIIRAIL